MLRTARTIFFSRLSFAIDIPRDFTVWSIEIENRSTFLEKRAKDAPRPVVFLLFRAITLLVASKQVPATKGWAVAQSRRRR